MIPFLIAVVALLASAVIYQEIRLRRLQQAVTTAVESASKKDPAPPPHHMPVICASSEDANHARKLVELLFSVHAWHGVSPGEKSPETVFSYIEIVPGDTVKYELDKHSGLLCIDRPQQFSSNPPTMYGFIPRTYCAELVGKACSDATGTPNIIGDGDPIDICVFSENKIPHGNILVRARVIGGLRMIDGNKADDKIIAVMVGDMMFKNCTDISELDQGQIDRLKHYFLTYKQLPGTEARKVEITHVYGREEAESIIGFSMQDYRNHYGAPESRLEQLRKLISH